MDTTQRPPSALSLLRLANGWTQAQLGSRAGGLARETVSRIERGARPQAATADALSQALGIPADKLFPAKPEDAAKAGDRS